MDQKLSKFEEKTPGSITKYKTAFPRALPTAVWQYSVEPFLTPNCESPGIRSRCRYGERKFIVGRRQPRSLDCTKMCVDTCAQWLYDALLHVPTQVLILLPMGNLVTADIAAVGIHVLNNRSFHYNFEQNVWQETVSVLGWGQKLLTRSAAEVAQIVCDGARSLLVTNPGRSRTIRTIRIVMKTVPNRIVGLVPAEFGDPETHKLLKIVGFGNIGGQWIGKNQWWQVTDIFGVVDAANIYLGLDMALFVK